MSDFPVAIVTDGTQGIGAAICIELLKKGYRVCVADIKESKGKEFVKEQKKTYGEENVTAIRCDVAKESDYTKLFEQTLEIFKRVDVLVNNAGIILESDPRKCLEVNLLGTLTGCHMALKYMGKSNGGNGGFVINTSSVAAFMACPQMPAFAASNHGIVALTRSFGIPFHNDKDGIIFAALCPFFIDTELLKTENKTLDPTLDFPQGIEKMSPEYMAKGVLKILEDKINGSALAVLPDGYHYTEFPDVLKKLMHEKE